MNNQYRLLADAIRLGCTMTLPHRQAFFGPSTNVPIRSTCAMGAALYAAGDESVRTYDADSARCRFYWTWETARELFPVVAQRAWHPEHKMPELIEIIIENLNDVHGWSREQIADWIETLAEDVFDANTGEWRDPITASLT